MAKLVSPEEKKLLLKLQSGDEQAFERIYEQYAYRLYGNLLKLVKSADTADELLHELFIKVWVNRHAIDTGKPFAPYLFRMARNLVHDFFRKAARDRKLESYLTASASERYDHIEAAIFHKESAAILEEALRNLPLQRRKIFTLCRLEGYSYEETAKLLGISPSTVGNQLVKATHSVRKYFYLSREGLTAILAVLLAGNQP